MLSKEAEKKLQQLESLLSQREEINRQIEILLIPVTVSEQQPELSPEQPAEPAPERRQRKGFHRGERIVPKFTDTEIEKMVRESDEGKAAREIIQEYGFKSVDQWYQLKNRYKKKQRSLAPLPSQDQDLPDYDAADDEEDSEGVLVDNPLHIPNNPPIQVKRYSYECKCGYSFKSTIPPQLIKCPDCMGKPKVVEEMAEK
jgi:hypothetical protein